MKKNFDSDRQARVARDRTFTLNGIEFTHRAAVAPEDVQEWSSMVGGEFVERDESGVVLRDSTNEPISSLTERQAITILDHTVLAFLEPGQEENWARARDQLEGEPKSANPINLEDLRVLVRWLFEETSARPTGPSSGSSGSTPGSASGGPGTSSTVPSPTPPVLVSA